MTIERAAKAIAANVGDPYVDSFTRTNARVALEAIIEPTQKMAEAGIASLGSDDERSSSEIVFDVWDAMITAMLTEKETKE